MFCPFFEMLGSMYVCRPTNLTGVTVFFYVCHLSNAPFYCDVVFGYRHW